MNNIQNQHTEEYLPKIIGRRKFLQSASVAALAFSLPVTPGLLKGTGMGVVVHSYGHRWHSKIDSKMYPGFSDAVEMLEHCHTLGAGGIQVGVKDWTSDFSKKLRERQEKLDLYLEGSIGMPGRKEDISRFEQEVVTAKEGGAVILRTVCTSGRRYEVFNTIQEFEEARKNALLSLRTAEPILRKHKVKLAVENHKDWRADELVSLIKQVDSPWIGVTLDFGNSIALMEDPFEVAKTLAPYAFTTHVKDMGVDEYADGLLLSEVPLGSGIIDLPKIVAVCKQYNPDITFNLEMITRDPLKIPCLKEEFWATFNGLPAAELARTLRMVKEKKLKDGLPYVSQLSAEAKLASEEENIISSFKYSIANLGLK